MAIRRSLRSALPVLALASVLGLSACGGGAGADAEGSPGASAASSSPTPSVDPRPTPASSTGPARNLPRPELPAAAKENTKAGFEAFTQYWFDTVTYALETGDTGPLKEVSKPDCKICNIYLGRGDRVANNDGWNVGPRWTVSGFSSDLKLDPLGQAVGYFSLDESQSTQFDNTGSLTKSLDGGKAQGAKALFAKYADGRWITSEAGRA